MAEELFTFDRELGSPLVVGVDEAGRGALAGPIVAGGVLFDYRTLDPDLLPALNDSKRLSARTREALYAQVLSTASRVAISIRSPRTIDESGLHVANLTVLGRCAELCYQEHAVVLADGYLPRTDLDARKLIRGDSTSAAVAAASVIAKVTRDRMMMRAAERHPGYGFDRHVGYGTKDHLQALDELGPCPAHRRSFAPVAARCS